MTLRQFGGAAAAVLFFALLAGWLFGRADPQRAARLLIRDRVVTEPAGEVASGPAPTSGDAVSGPTCGVLADVIPTQQQVDAIAGGVVVLQYADDADASRVAEIAGGAPHDVLAGPNPDIDARIVATAWTRRMRLDQFDGDVVRAFVTAHAGVGPDVRPCG